MTRIPSTTDIATRAPARIGVPSAVIPIPNLSVPRVGVSPLQVVGAAITRISEKALNAQRARQVTESDRLLIVELAAAEEAASKTDTNEAAIEAFQSSLDISVSRIESISDPFVRDIATQRLELRSADAIVRVRRASRAREGRRGIAADDQHADELIGQITADKISVEDAIDQYSVGVELKIGSSYDAAQAASLKDAFAARAVLTEFERIMDLPMDAQFRLDAVKALMKTSDAIENLPAGVIADRIREAENVIAREIAQDVASINNRAVSFSIASDILGLAALLPEIQALPDPHRKDLTIQINARIKAAQSTISQAQLLNEVLAGRSDQAPPLSPQTVAKVVREAQDSGTTDGLVRQFLQRGLGVPLGIVNQIKQDARRETLNLPRFLKHIFIIGEFSRTDAERLASASGDIGEVAYFATRDLDDADHIQARLEVLKGENVGRFLDDLNILIDPRSKNVDQDAIDAPAKFVISGLPARRRFGGVFGLPLPRRQSILGPQEMGQLNNLRRFRFIEQLELFNESDIDKALSNSAALAARDFNAAHLGVDVAKRGVYFVPLRALDLNGPHGANVAADELRQVISKYLIGAGPSSGILPAKIFTDDRRERSYIPASTGLGVISAFIEWDSTSGTASIVSDASDADLFKELEAQLLGTDRDRGFQSRPELTRLPQHGDRPLEQVDSDGRIRDAIMATALEIYKSLNNGQIPDRDNQAEMDRLFSIAETIAAQGDW